MKRGFMDFERLLVVLLLFMFAVTTYSVFRVMNMKSFDVDTPSAWLKACQETTRVLNSELKYATLVSLSSDTLVVIPPEGQPLSYQIASDSLIRIDAQGKGLSLIDNLQTGTFSRNASLTSLISVLLLPRDTLAMPYFTSFCLRGGKP